MTSPSAPELPHGDPRVVAGMFDRIARRYDLLNHLLSVGVDNLWRRFAAGETRLRPGDRALDVACGTGDLAFELARRVSNRGRVVGLDISREMLVLARVKGRRRGDHMVEYHWGDAMRLPYADGSFQAVTMAFGGRNVPDLTGVFREMERVLAHGGRLVHLELNRPRLWGFRHVFDWYFHTLAPLVGGWVSGDRSAYEYLPRSVDNFEDADAITVALIDAGLQEVGIHPLMFGVALVHVGVKR